MMQQGQSVAETGPIGDDILSVQVYRPSRGRDFFRLAAKDFWRGLALSRLSCALGWMDIKMRYRGSILGPFWLTLSTAVMVSALGLLYARLFKMPVHDYLPFLALSLVMWGYISTLWTEGAGIFTSNSELVLSSDMPFFVYIFRAAIRNFIVLAHQSAVILVVFYLCAVMPASPHLIAAGLVLWFIDSIAVMTLLGVLGTRFRDVAPSIAAVLQIFFFITPIMWKPELARSMQPWLIYNPFYPLMEIIRMPALGQVTPMKIWEAALIHSALLMTLATLVFSRFRSRLAYWV